MGILSIDVGTTHCKAAVFSEDGRLLGLSAADLQTRPDLFGHRAYLPEELWAAVAQSVRSALRSAHANQDFTAIQAIGVASMAETGLLLDPITGAERTSLLAWFDTSATPQALRLANTGDPIQRFLKAGIRPSFKCGLAKLLWLKDHGPDLLPGAVWLSVADYVIFRLTGQTATDFSLAGRTYAFDLDRKEWDAEWLASFGLPVDLFPSPSLAGTKAGETLESASELGLAPGIPAVVAGHDHVCGALAAGAIDPGQVYDSLGTAETFMGALPDHPLDEAAFRSGLSYGCHTAPGRRYWLGGLSTSGGALEWLRSILGDPPLSYAQVEQLLDQAGAAPGSILFFPYLAGSGSPHTDLLVRGAFFGLTATHTRADLVKAVLEGTAYELEYIRRAAEAASRQPIRQIRAAGGGTRLRRWMQIKADVSGIEIETLAMPEATLLGAARVAAGAAGTLHNPDRVLEGAGGQAMNVYLPDSAHHRIYQDVYEQAYLKLLDPVRQFSTRGIFHGEIAASTQPHSTALPTTPAPEDFQPGPGS